MILYFYHLKNISSGNLEAIERIAYELCEDQARDGVIYFEGRFAPHLLSTTHGASPDQSHNHVRTPDVTPAMVLDSMLAGLKRGEQDFNVKARVILCCMRGSSFKGNSLSTFRLFISPPLQLFYNIRLGRRCGGFVP